MGKVPFDTSAPLKARSLSASRSGRAIRHHLTHAAAGLLLVIAGLLYSSTPAFAEFVRPFKSVAMEGTPTGLFGEVGCITINTRENEINTGNIWVGDASNGVIDEFNASNEFFSQSVGKPTGSCAYDDSTGELISVGVYEWVAVDNSNSGGMGAGDIYFGREGNSLNQGGVERVNEKGNPAPFTCLESGVRPEYISGNRLTGNPGEPKSWENTEAVGGVAVSSSGGSAGDIYVIDRINGHDLAVDVFSPTGCFEPKKSIEYHGAMEELFAGRLTGVAIDPTNDDVLIKGVSSEGTKSIIGEFTSSGEYLGKITGPSQEVDFNLKGAGGGIAVNYKGDLYDGVDEVTENEKHEIVSEKHVVDEFGEGAYFPSAVTGGITGASLGAGTLNGTLRGAYNGVKKENLILSKCYFQYATEAEYQQSLVEKGDGFSELKHGDQGDEVPCVLVGGGVLLGARLEEKNYAVDAAATDLKSGTTYQYRVVAETSEVERGGLSKGAAESFAAPGASPSVDAMSVDDVSSSYADFHAEVNPLGAETTYRFEYINEAGLVGMTPEVSIGPGASDVGVFQQVGGLSPGTTYRVRVLARNAYGSTAGVGGSGVYETFTTLPASVQVLPDGRAYELVTPPNKGDAEDMFGVSKEEIFGENFDVGYSSASGDEFILSTKAAFGSFAAQGENAYVFSRSTNAHGEAEWGFKPVASPGLGIQSLQSLVHGPDLSVVGAGDIVGKEQGREQVDDLVGPAGGPYTVVMSTSSGGSHVVGTSANMAHVVVESADHEMPTTPLPLCESSQEGFVEKQATQDEFSNDLYEWSTGQQCLALVNVKQASEGGGLVSSCGATLGQGPGRAGGTHSAVSGDGSRIFFTAPDPDVSATGLHCWFESGFKLNGKYTPQVYMRADGKSTVEVSAPEAGVVPKVTYPSVFVGASEDGSKVFFVTKTELTAGAVKAKTSGLELYECEVVEVEGGKPKCRLKRVSQGVAGAEGDVHFVAAVSADGSTVYFDAGAKLTPEAPGGGLYRYDTAIGDTTYVAPESKYPNPEPFLWYEAGATLGEFVFPGEVGLDPDANYYTTRNGEFLVFESPAGDMYRYDADSTVSSAGHEGMPENPLCVSCNPDGKPPTSSSEFARSAVRVDNPAGAQPRPISEESSNGPEGGENNGSHVFFDTAESLVAQDTNGKVDVYEWEEDGAGSCIEASGCLSLITSGQDSLNSFFLDSSENGSNVFFGTHSQLVPQDTDTEGDLYDARVCTVEEPCVKPPVGSTGQCEGDACAASSPASTGLALASSTFAGAGDLNEGPPPKAEKKCAKGKRLSHGKCVKTASRKKSKKKRKATSRRGGKVRSKNVRGTGSRGVER